ncbi:MAG: GIY-YIG nuclease family protein [Armatimonadota bacterium]
MESTFNSHISALRSQLNRLLAMEPVTPETLPQVMPRKGIYLLSESDQHLYVGRSDDIRGRIGRHSKPSANHRKAAFAFRIAREETGYLRATYKPGDGSRDGLMANPVFRAAFEAAKRRIRQMDLRFVEEVDPVRQALLEIYVATVLETPYNDFGNH